MSETAFLITKVQKRSQDRRIHEKSLAQEEKEDLKLGS